MERDIYYDTSILNNLCSKKNIESFNRFVKDVAQKKLLKEENAFVISTPTLFLETIGLGKIKKVIALKELNDEIANIIQQYGLDKPVMVLDKILELIVFRLKSAETIKVGDLKKMLDSKKGLYNSWWDDQVIKVLENHLKSPESHEDIVEHLALEILQDINYEDFITGNDLKSLMSHLLFYLYSCSQQQNKNFFMVRSVLKRARVINFEGQGLLATGQDYADMELIHFSMLGHRRNYKCLPVRVFTFESKQLCSARLAVYYSTLKYIHELFVDLRKKPINFQPGIIHHLCPNTGRIKGTTFVRNLLERFENQDYEIQGLSISSGQKTIR